MTLQLHTLSPATGSRRKRKVLGRGNASGHGTYSGKGLKGQRARSGGRRGLKFMGYKKLLEQIPQSRGFTSLNEKQAVINLSSINAHFNEGDTITPARLASAGLVELSRAGVKVLGGGALQKRMTFKNLTYSSKAREAIKKSGGTIV